MSHLFSGTGVALVTPFQDNETVDYAGLEKLINSAIEGGVNYLVALGTTAETPTLSAEEKRDVLSFIINKCNKRVPVVCGVGGNNTAEIVQQLSDNHLEGVDGILSVSPYYNKPTQEGIYQHFKAIAQATELPIILYNVPGRTASNMAAETTLRLAKDFKNIVAVKEASGNMVQCMELVQGKPEGFAILSGDDNLILPQIAIGMEGVISVAANCYTKDFTTMVNQALKGNFTEARKLHYKLLKGIDLLFAEGNPAGVKYVLSQQSICIDKLRLPLVSVSKATATAINDFMKGL